MRVKQEMKISVLSLAVQGALAAMCVMPMTAYAADPSEAEIAVIRRPTNYVEIGVGDVSDKSARFGEYNGLNKAGTEFIGNFSVRGGDAYEGGDGTMRWGVAGTDIGTTSRAFNATVGNQGTWNFGIGYDELRHNTTDGYQTPYNGYMGGNYFTLPFGYGTVADTRQLMSAAQLGAMHTVDINNTRKNTSLNAGFNLGKEWSIKVDYNHLDQSGAKLMAFGGDTHGGAAGETPVILPNPTNYRTDTVNLALNWVGDKGHVSGSYYGSFFHDNFNSVQWETFQGANVIDKMSTAPSNAFHQLNLTGGYALAAKTKLTAGFSYGRNTQNDAFATPWGMMMTAPPQQSLQGVIATSHLDVKVADQTFKDWSLSAGFKYDKRDNRTASNIYQFVAINGGNQTSYPNSPYSNQKERLELAADYRLSANQRLALAYDHEYIKRWCSSYAYPGNYNCVVATDSQEDKLGGTYKLKVSDALNMNVGYSVAKRATNSDMSSREAFSTASKITALWTGTGFATLPGTNANDYPGFHPYFNGSRNQQILKAGGNWQASDQLSLGLTGRYTKDDYPTMFGVLGGNSWNLNMDATYAYSDTGTVSGYITPGHTERNQKIATSELSPLVSALSYSYQVHENDRTIGLAFKQTGLFGGKFALDGDLSYSAANTSQYTSFDYYSGASITCSAAATMTCGNLPDVKNTTTRLKLTGTYNVDKVSKIAVGYLFSRLKSDDYFYNGYQYGLTPTQVMPTNQQSGSYTVNAVAVSYMYSFK